MRPWHFATDHTNGVEAGITDMLASMRPWHFATDHKASSTVILSGKTRFNEAVALRHGSLKGLGLPTNRTWASMRPWHFATDHGWAREGRGRWRCRFNEAVALRHGSRIRRCVSPPAPALRP